MKASLEESEMDESPPPTSLQPPPGYQREGDWKIIISVTAADDDDTRDSLGCTHVWSSNNARAPPTRRRTWLRRTACITTTTTIAFLVSLEAIVALHFHGFATPSRPLAAALFSSVGFYNVTHNATVSACHFLLLRFQFARNSRVNNTSFMVLFMF